MSVYQTDFNDMTLGNIITNYPEIFVTPTTTPKAVFEIVESSPGRALGCTNLYAAYKNFLGVKAVPALGEKFDPNFHEAVMQREDPDVDDNTVLEVIQKGYLLNDRLLRPSMVVVSKRPA